MVGDEARLRRLVPVAHERVAEQRHARGRVVRESRCVRRPWGRLACGHLRGVVRRHELRAQRSLQARRDLLELPGDLERLDEQPPVRGLIVVRVAVRVPQGEGGHAVGLGQLQRARHREGGARQPGARHALVV